MTIKFVPLRTQEDYGHLAQLQFCPDFSHCRLQQTTLLPGKLPVRCIFYLRFFFNRLDHLKTHLNAFSFLVDSRASTPAQPQPRQIDVDAFPTRKIYDNFVVGVMADPRATGELKETWRQNIQEDKNAVNKLATEKLLALFVHFANKNGIEVNSNKALKAAYKADGSDAFLEKMKHVLYTNWSERPMWLENMEKEIMTELNWVYKSPSEKQSTMRRYCVAKLINQKKSEMISAYRDIGIAAHGRTVKRRCESEVSSTPKRRRLVRNNTSPVFIEEYDPVTTNAASSELAAKAAENLRLKDELRALKSDLAALRQQGLNSNAQNRVSLNCHECFSLHFLFYHSNINSILFPECESCSPARSIRVDGGNKPGKIVCCLSFLF